MLIRFVFSVGHLLVHPLRRRSTARCAAGGLPPPAIEAAGFPQFAAGWILTRLRLMVPRGQGPTGSHIYLKLDHYQKLPPGQIPGVSERNKRR